VGGDLPEDEANRVERHLAECPRCREELSRYEKSRKTLFLLKTVPGSAPDLWPGIRESIRTGAGRIRHLPLRLAAAVLLVAVCVSAALLVPGPRSVPPSAAPPAPEAAAEAPDAQFFLAEASLSTEGFLALPTLRPAGPERRQRDEF
jgi:anti-sigma factor RsiW